MGKIEIDFRVVSNDTYDNAFKIMKEYQNAGMADKNSCIIFNGVRVPAGFYDKWEDSFKLYNSIIEKNPDGIKDSLPNNITEEEIFTMEGVIDYSYYQLHEERIDPDFLDQIIEDRRNKNKESVK